MAAPYTPRQGQFLAYIHAYTALHGEPPSEVEIAAHLNVSPPSAHQMLVTLERRGLIRRTPGQSRSVRILLPQEAIPDMDSGRRPPATPRAFETSYPHIASWIADGGWVELGRTDYYTTSMARALDEGGMVWEGKDSYADLDELLGDLEAGIAVWEEKNG